jgi:hypothetical protein
MTVARAIAAAIVAFACVTCASAIYTSPNGYIIEGELNGVNMDVLAERLIGMERAITALRDANASMAARIVALESQVAVLSTRTPALALSIGMNESGQPLADGSRIPQQAHLSSRLDGVEMLANVSLPATIASAQANVSSLTAALATRIVPFEAATATTLPALVNEVQANFSNRSYLASRNWTLRPAARCPTRYLRCKPTSAT